MSGVRKTKRKPSRAARRLISLPVPASRGGTSRMMRIATMTHKNEAALSA